MSHFAIARFNPHEEAALEQLLATAELPTEDLTPEMLEHFLAAHVDHALVGAIGLEPFGDAGLLRSLAVDEAHRGTGLGSKLVEALEEHARDQGVRELYLLTTTAEDFFLKLGYRRLPREQAPDAIAATAQFSQLCPSSSAFMVKPLFA